MSLTQIRTDLANRADTISGLTVYKTPRDQIEVPSFIVGPLESAPYNHDFGKSKNLYRLTCRLYAGRDLDEAFLTLDPFLLHSGASSIKAVLDNQVTHNTGSADWTNVVEARDMAAYDVGGVSYIGVEFVVEVLA